MYAYAQHYIPSLAYTVIVNINIELISRRNIMEFINNKSNTTESTKLEQARGGNLFNRNGATPEAIELMASQRAPIIAFIEQMPTNGRLPKAIGCQVFNTCSHWLFSLAENAEHCKIGVPYIFTVKEVFFNRDDTPGLLVKPLVEISPALLENERFGDFVVKAGFPMHWPQGNSYEWDYAPLRKQFNLPDTATEIDVCKHAANQAIAGKISFEEIVELIHLPKSLVAGSFGGADAVKPGTLRYQESTGNKPKRKRTCKGKKYKEPRQKPASTVNANNGKSGKGDKNKDGGKKKKGK